MGRKRKYWLINGSTSKYIEIDKNLGLSRLTWATRKKYKVIAYAKEEDVYVMDASHKTKNGIHHTDGSFVVLLADMSKHTMQDVKDAMEEFEDPNKLSVMMVSPYDQEEDIRNLREEMEVHEDAARALLRKIRAVTGDLFDESDIDDDEPWGD
ncbi:MAG: hypothetical protein SVK08_01565 [Halobacteriota archaeon]|nr:hypothetical protein [Halobacteriota archaeon]